jgi:hypothetical protein
MQQLSGTRQRAAILLVAVLLLLATTNVVLLAQNLGAAPQTNVAVQGQTGAQPEGAFLNLVNWIGNVIAPVGAALAIAGGLVAYIAGRGAMRYVVTALGCLAVSGVTRLLEFWINQGGGGVS